MWTDPQEVDGRQWAAEAIEETERKGVSTVADPKGKTQV